jgi:RNA polymerase sigma-70 factor (ECF subfamily)
VAELTQALNADLDRAFTEVIDTYQDRLYRFGLRLTANPHDAEEIAQEAFFRAYRWLKDHTPVARDFQIQAWLYRISLNIFRNRARRSALPTTQLDEAENLGGSNGTQPAAHTEQRELAADLSRLLAALPRRYREAVVLRHVEDLSYAEIGSLLERPEGTVKSDVHRGLVMLRAAITHSLEEALA